MKIFVKSATWFYQFLRSGVWFLIAIPSWMCQECNGMVLWPGKVLLMWKQFQAFWQKFPMLFLILGAASVFLWLGLGLCIYVEWIRLTIQAQQPLHWWFGSLIFHVIFFNLFHVNYAKFGRFCPCWLAHEILSMW